MLTIRRRRIKQLWSRPAADKLLVAQAFVLLGMTRLAIKALSFNRLERLMGERNGHEAECSAADLKTARRVGWAVRNVSAHTPWESNCFPQALTAKLLLRRRGIGSTLCLGATFNDDKTELSAHAWLRCGDLHLTGGDGGEHFGTLASYR